ncbi:MAG TPA: ribosome biogenesis GTPase Der [Candidatus Peribacteraceae bacterium]|nr:ribosome biogenesis GTPase Der [Candidatus Peribacteraceae bacterium]
MPRIPTVAIIGRPNTGKSTLFNRLVGKRRAIESDVAGTTRDHVAYKVETDEMDYLLLDTGGIGGGSTDKDFEQDVSAQSVIALAAADVIIFTVNSKEELTSSDERVAELLRKKKKAHVPVIVVATKCDRPDTIDDLLPQYFAFGLGDDVIGLSAVHNTGIGELEDAIIEKLKELHFEKEDSSLEAQATKPPRIAIVGKPNVGKSSVVNALMSDPQREMNARIVSDIPGTTRDSSDTIIRRDDKDYIFIDTAGLRRKARVEEDLEYLSNVKSIQAVEDSDVTILMLDAADIISRQDKRIASLAIESGKGLMIVLNKTDKLTREEREEKETETRASLPFCKFAPLLFTSATTRENLPKLFPMIESIARNRLRRIPTKELLRWYEEAVHGIPANMLAKSKFITQAEEIPPTFVIFVRDPKKVGVSQLRYLDNRLRETFAFEGTPVKWITKKG